MARPPLARPPLAQVPRSGAGGGADGVLGCVVELQRRHVDVVLVHGGGPEISALMKRFGKEPRFVGGLRVTDRETVEIAEMVLAGKVNKDLVGRIGRLGGRALGICGKDAGLLLARKRQGERNGGEEVDLGFVGDVVAVDPFILQVCRENGIIPVVASVAPGVDGETYNVNADAAAAAIAAATGARWLCLLTDVPGIMLDPADPASLQPSLSPARARDLLGSGVISRGMVPKVEACLEALAAGVTEAVIMDGGSPEMLFGLLSGADVPCTRISAGAGGCG